MHRRVDTMLAERRPCFVTAEGDTKAVYPTRTKYHDTSSFFYVIVWATWVPSTQHEQSRAINRVCNKVQIITTNLLLNIVVTAAINRNHNSELWNKKEQECVLRRPYASSCDTHMYTKRTATTTHACKTTVRLDRQHHAFLNTEEFRIEHTSLRKNKLPESHTPTCSTAWL